MGRRDIPARRLMDIEQPEQPQRVWSAAEAVARLWEIRATGAHFYDRSAFREVWELDKLLNERSAGTA